MTPMSFTICNSSGRRGRFPAIEPSGRGVSGRHTRPARLLGRRTPSATAAACRMIRTNSIIRAGLLQVLARLDTGPAARLMMAVQADPARPEIESPLPALPPTVIRMFIAPGLQLPAGFTLPVAPARDTRI